ncbi:hypothetical protein WJX74_011098 [Apatococcus lobatus]|uniref:C2H2-type domain-containing protein n=1 Tax=Apatococcus lobatus TaxID=904363 RepID=A0AAW1QCU9_9CHLO
MSTAFTDISKPEPADPRLKKKARRAEDSAGPETDVAASSHMTLSAHEAAMDDKVTQLSRQHLCELRRAEEEHATVRATMASSHRDKVRQLADSAQAETSAAVARINAMHAQQVADLKHKHAAALAEAQQAAQKRTASGKQFTYAVRGSSEPHLRGSVPRCIFDAEPGSMIARMYNGEWEYPKDEHGRALVNSNPAHWQLIVDWLSFSTVPASPSPEFIQECRFWQLTNLLAVIDPAPEPEPPQPTADVDHLADTMVLSKPDICDLTIRCDSQGCRARFTAEGYLHNFCDRHNGTSGDDDIVFKVFGQTWILRMRHHMMRLTQDEFADTSRMSVRMSAGKDPVTQILNEGNSWGGDYLENVVDYQTLNDNLFLPPYINGHGSIFISLTVTYP